MTMKSLKILMKKPQTIRSKMNATYFSNLFDQISEDIGNRYPNI